MKNFRAFAFLCVLFAFPLVLVSCKKEGPEDHVDSRPGSPSKSDSKISDTKAVEGSKPIEGSKSPKKVTVDSIKPANTLVSKPHPTIDPLVEKRYPMPEFMSLERITNNWTRIPERSLPEVVMATSSIECTFFKNGAVTGQTTIKPGSKLKPLKVIGNQLTVASLKDASIQTRVPISQTDLKQAIEKRYNGLVEDYKNKILAQRASAKAALLKRPERVEKFTNARSGGGPVPPQILTTVKNSIKRGDAGPGKLSEAKNFSWNGTESLGGDFDGTYETVTVSFETVTIFGSFPNEFKCVLSDGRVEGWIDPISEERVDR